MQKKIKNLVNRKIQLFRRNKTIQLQKYKYRIYSNKIENLEIKIKY